MDKKKPPRETKTFMLRVRMTPEERAAWGACAAMCGKTVSEWVRAICNRIARGKRK